MPYNTRLDGRSPSNKAIYIKDSSGELVATVEATGKSADLAITTEEGYKVDKETARE
jgi:hypothetical protein